MSAGEFFVAAVVVGMVLAILAFSIRKGSRHAGMRHYRSGRSDIDPGLSYLMTPGAMSDGSSHVGGSGHHGHQGHHGHHGHDAGHHAGHDHASHGSFDSCSPVDSGGGFDGGGCDGGGGGDGGGGCGGDS